MKQKHQIPTFVSGFFIFILCLLPGSSFPEISWSAAFSLDKWVHFFLYAAWFFVYRYFGGAQIWLAAWLMFVFGGCIELFQEYVLTYRSGEWLDWAADGLGILFAIFLFSTWNFRKMK